LSNGLTIKSVATILVPAVAAKNIKNVVGQTSDGESYLVPRDSKKQVPSPESLFPIMKHPVERSIPYSFFRTPYLYQIVSGILLALCYPSTGWGFLAWFALVPLLASLHHAQNHSQALGFGLITGIVFFVFSIHWLTYVSTVGWLIMVVIESIFIMGFSWLAYLGIRSKKSVLFKVLWIALTWTVAEILRSEIPVFGFGWNLLAYSQSSYVPLIQFAKVLGSYGLGFLIVWVNASFLYAWFRRKDWRTALGLLSVVVLILAGLWGFGNVVLLKPVAPSEYLRVSVVQGNIPQDKKWEPTFRREIVDKYETLTISTVKDSPDLIIWPETSVPGFVENQNSLL
ncbi:MAG: hypothetical protein WCP87_07350, partial [Atribacterota bacterium]